MKQYRQVFYVIGFLILIALLGYFLANYSWDKVMHILTATETPTPTLIFTPTPT